MTTLASLYAEKDFLALRAQFIEHKSPVAALLMASIAYSGKNKESDEFKTKKALGEFIQNESVNCLKEAANGGDIRAIRELGSMQMFGRIVNIPFGSTICLSNTTDGCKTYQSLIEHPDASDDDKAFAYYCIGHMTELSTRPYAPDPNREHSNFTNAWISARECNTRSKGYLFASMRLAEWYLSETKEFNLALPLFEEIKDVMPYAHAHLANMYSQGLGVDINKELASEHQTMFKNNVDKYKLKCGSKKDNEIDVAALLAE